MATLEATQKTIEQVVNVMDENDLRSILRAPKSNIKVDMTKWQNFAARQFREAVDGPLRSNCRHGGSVHWGWLMEGNQAGRNCEYSVANQRKAVMGANAALVQVVDLFGKAAEDDLKWNFLQITGNVWQDKDLSWDTSTIGVPWETPYRAIHRRAPPKGMSRVRQAIIQYEKVASHVFNVEWSGRRPQDSQSPWGEYRLYATNTAMALGESVYNLVQAGMYGAAFALARASRESAANAHYVWNEEPSPQVLLFLQEEHSQRPIPLPKSQSTWKNRTAKKWALLTGKGAKVLAELAKGERVQGQRWMLKAENPECCPYGEGELTNLVRFAAMNLMFLKASYFHFEQSESTDMFVSLMEQWDPEWPTFEVSGGVRSMAAR